MSTVPQAITSRFIDSSDLVRNLIDTIVNLPTSPPSLYLDLEGVKLGRQGSISILQIFAVPADCVYLIDVHILKSHAFQTPGTDGQTTLNSILESDNVPKVFFDVRNDSDALHAHFGVKLGGVQDIQLMELGARNGSKNGSRLNSLKRCIERHARLTPTETAIWQAVKERGQNLYDPDRGGTYEVFNARPLSGDLLAYCVQDVRFMPKLLETYKHRLSPHWAAKTAQATRDRVVQSQSPTFNGKGAHMAFGPW
ncbi:MAG: hypothetical protein Q9201_001328 [Fulgogasparrea decipioides]